MREDTFTRDEAGAREHAAILGASEWIGGGGGDEEPVGGIPRLGVDPWLPCDHRLLDDPVGLLCTRADVHLIGHTYASSTGSEVPDKHTEHVDD